MQSAIIIFIAAFSFCQVSLTLVSGARIFKPVLIEMFLGLVLGPKKFTYKGHNYFYSGTVPALATKRVDWLEARNICREYCMDAVSIETQEENNLIFKLIQENDVPYIWTSGRLCDFNGGLTDF